MKKILVSNIGNRNLVYRDIKGLLGLKKNDFRIETQFLLDNYDEWKNEINLKILDVLLEEKIGEIEKVFLFVTDQEKVNPEMCNQDTIFEGEILSRLIPERFGLPVELLIIYSEPVNLDALIKEYRTYLKNLFQIYPSASFIFCTSGGAPYQKDALKICSEYMLSPDRYEFYQVVEVARKEKDQQVARESIPKKVSNVEYRKILDLEQIISLVRQGFYQPAAEIYVNQVVNPTKDIIYNVLLMAENRKNLMHNFAKAIIRGLSHQELKSYGFDFAIDYLKDSPRGNYSKWQNYLEQKDFVLITEILELANYYYQLANYTFASLYYSIFIERFLYSFVSRLSGYNLQEDYRGQKEAFLSFANRKLKENGISKEYNILNMPLMIDLSFRLYKDDLNQNVLESFRRANSNFGKNKGLDIVRNNFAHKGVGIELKEFDHALPDHNKVIRQWNKEIGISDTNIYLQMNEKVIESLRKR